MYLSVGDEFTVERTFYKEDVERFVEISGDRNPPHIIPDEKGRLLVHGLLTATLPTIIGGRYHVIGRTVEYNFSALVYTGDCISCSCTVTDVEKRDYGTKVRVEFRCKNQDEITVLTGYFFGIIFEAN